IARGTDSATLTESASIAPTVPVTDAATLTDSGVVQVASNASDITPQRLNVEIDWADSGAFTYQMEVLVDQPVGYWRLGELSGTSAADQTGNGHTGTYHGGPTLATPGLISGDLNTGITLNGTNQYVEIPDA
ncbi:MAG: hypothetical protein KGL39_31670, partial [Patescibacteria group bacterium]|nr:hypothetical protein [Patescibacteria group bacterium]